MPNTKIIIFILIFIVLIALTATKKIPLSFWKFIIVGVVTCAFFMGVLYFFKKQKGDAWND